MSVPHLSLVGVRVLVVDDDRDERELFTFVFESHGAEVVAAASAERALEALTLGRPDVLVSDICLPHMDGYGLIEALRRRSADEGGQIPAVAVTGWTEAGEHTRAIEAGYQVHLSKPVSLDTLIAVVTGLTRTAQAVENPEVHQVADVGPR